MSLQEWFNTYWYWGVLGLALAFLPYVRKASTYYSTLIHEIGHGVSSLNPIGGLGGISIRPDTSGENQVSYQSGGLLFMPIRIGSLMAGYAAPIYAGAAFLIVSAFQLETVFKWSIMIICALTIFAIRNLFGAAIILIHAAFWSAVVFLGVIPIYPVLVTLGIVLLARGITDYLQVAKYSFVKTYKGMGTDFDLLQQEFLLPRQVWFILFTIGHSIILFFLISFITLTNMG